MYRGSESIFFDFSGGMASNRFGLTVDKNQALLLRNINILPKEHSDIGGGIEKRRGNTVFNSTAMSSGDAVHGLGYFRQSDGDEWLMAIAGTKIFKADNLDGTMDDITNVVTITTGANNIWTFTVMNDIAIFVGGAPDAPLKWTGSGNAAALGGSPPSGSFGFTHNNRFFIGNSAANPSQIAWSILGNPEDWSGVGSGNQDIEKNDGDTLVGAAALNTDVVLLFKQNSIHQFITRTNPFPYFPLFRGVGAVGKGAIVEADGYIYFITPRARMKATNGSSIIDFPSDVDNIWDTVSASRLPYIKGIRYTGSGFDHLIWLCSSGASQTTNNLAIVWDLKNKCWLQHTTGYKANAAVKTQNGILYTGHYDGKIYKQDVANTYTDASETSPGTIDGLWRSGWNIQKSIERSLQLSRLNIGLVSQSAGILTVGYGYDFATDQYLQNIDMQAPGSLWNEDLWDVAIWGGQSDVIRHIGLKGRGNTFQVTFRNNIASQTFKIHGYSISGKQSSVKTFQAI